MPGGGISAIICHTIGGACEKRRVECTGRERGLQRRAEVGQVQ